MRLASIQCSKMRLRRGSALDPAGGAYSAPPDSLAGFKGASSRDGEGRLTLMCSWNTAADWLRPVLLSRQEEIVHILRNYLHRRGHVFVAVCVSVYVSVCITSQKVTNGF